MCCASVMCILCVAAGSTRFKTSLILVPPHEMPCRQYFENLLRCSSICEGPNFYVIITPLAGDFVKNFQWAIEQHVFSNLAVLWPRTEALVHSCLLPGANKQINVKLKNLCTRPLKYMNVSFSISNILMPVYTFVKYHCRRHFIYLIRF